MHIIISSDLDNPLAWVLPLKPQHPFTQLSKLLLFAAVFSQKLAMFLSYQVLGPSGSCKPLSKFIDLTQFSLAAVLSSHLVFPPFPDVAAHIKLLLRIALLPYQVVELIHRQSYDVLDIKHDPPLPSPLLVLP